MTELTKPSSETPEDTSTEEPQNAGDKAKTEYRDPVIIGMAARLFTMAIAFIPIGAAVGAMIKPEVSGKLSGSNAKALDLPGSLHGTVVEARLTDPALWERAAAGLPMLSMGLALLVLGYAMYRMDVNMTQHTRPYTDKDHRWLHRADFWVYVGWAVALVANSVLPGLLPSANGLDDVQFVPVLSETWLLLPLTVCTAGLVRLHHAAKGQFEKLEKIV